MLPFAIGHMLIDTTYKDARKYLAKSIMDFFPEGALGSILLNAPHEQLWSLSDLDVVWRYQEIARENGLDSCELFFKHVIECIDKRMERAKVPAFNPAEEGRWLHFNPNHSLFEDVAIDETNGFYGSGDCPPPEFWTHIEGEVLVSFIPKKYIALADIGVRICVAENVEWASK